MKKYRLKEFSVFITILLLSIFTLPLAFSKNNGKTTFTAAAINNATGNNTIKSGNRLLEVYDSLNLDELGLSEEAFDYVIAGYEKLKQGGKVINDQVISRVDVTKPSF